MAAGNTAGPPITERTAGNSPTTSVQAATVTGTELEQLSRAERMLAAVATAAEARDVVDLAAAVADLAKRAKLGVAAVNHATAIRVRAERRLAELVDEGQAAGTIAGPHVRADVRAQDITGLPELGVDRRRLSEARRLDKSYTDADILELAAAATADDRELTRASLLKSNAQLIHSSESVEWYTPSDVIEAARRVLGGIDLDPASSDLANQTVQASRYYTAADDGLTQPWKGRVWMNPPYSGLAGPFVARLADAYEAGDVTAAIVLVSAYSIGASWWRPLLGRLLCFVHGRVRFWNPGGAPAQTPFTSVLAYYGPDEAAFAAEFARFGALMTPWQGGP